MSKLYIPEKIVYSAIHNCDEIHESVAEQLCDELKQYALNEDDIVRKEYIEE